MLLLNIKEWEESYFNSIKRLKLIQNREQSVWHNILPDSVEG